MDGAGPDPQGSFSLSPAKFPGCSSAVRLPSPERLLAPSAAGNGPDNCSSRAGDFSICICMDPTHASSPKPQLVFSSDLLSTYYRPSSVVSTLGGAWTRKGQQGGDGGSIRHAHCFGACPLAIVITTHLESEITSQDGSAWLQVPYVVQIKNAMWVQRKAR